MTKAMFVRSAAALWLLLALALSVRSEEAPKAPSQTYVVLVGVSNYADKQIKPRPFAEADAKALYDVFIDKKYLGVDPHNIRLLLGGEDAKRHSQAATRDNIIKSLQWVSEKASAN